MLPKQKTIRQKNKKSRHLHRIPIERLSPEHTKGLTESQAKEREEKGWANLTVDPPSESVGEIIFHNTFTYFNLIFVVLAALLCVAGSFRDLTFLPVILANTCIGIIQEIRAKKVLAKMSMLNAPHARVIRDGTETVVASERLVLDDIVLFQSGDHICADASVVNGEVRVNESLLTGESDEILKKTGDRLMSGSFLVAGSCHARLTEVGPDSYISRLTLEAKSMKKGEQSEMIRSLNKLIKIVGIILIPIAIILFSQSWFFNGSTFRASITSMVAAVIGMIPEGLYLLTSVALAVSAIRLASQHVLLHDMKSIETLARVNVLCVDKTGTITENTMRVHEVLPVEACCKASLSKTDSGAFASTDDSIVSVPMDDTALSKLLGDFIHVMSGDNSTMEALKCYFTQSSGPSPIHVSPFTSRTKYSGASFESGTYVLGAPEFILREQYDSCRQTIETHSSKGYRVLVFASYDGILDGEPLVGKAVPLAYILLSNPVRKEAADTFRYFAEQGVSVKVISGDNPMTVSEAARQAGIPGHNRYVDASTLHTQEDIAGAVAEYTVFGRVTPSQKKQFVQALKAQGNTVAMTGDGVNDVLALKDADCSIAMASGCDAAMQAAQVVLLHSDFSCMPSVVMEGRRVVNNIQRTACLFLIKNMFSFLLALFSMACMFTYPLLPSQVSLVSMFTIGVPAFFLALQPNKDLIKGHFLTNVLFKALPAGLTDFLVVASLVVFGKVFGVHATDISTAATILLTVVGFMILFRICQPLNRLRAVIWVGSILGMLGCMLFLPDLFAITGMSTECILLSCLFAVSTEPVFRYLTLFIGKLRESKGGLMRRRRVEA